MRPSHWTREKARPGRRSSPPRQVPSAGRGRAGGFILISLYLVLTLLILLGASLVTRALADVRSSQWSTSSAQSFYLAEAAVDQGYQWLKTQSAPPGGITPLVLNGGWQNLGADGRFLVTVDPADNNPTTFLKRYILQGWGSVGTSTATPTATRLVYMTVQVESFARYAYFTDSELSPSGSTVWFNTGDRIEGPTHTNGRFSMRGTPTFDGPVSSVATSINYYNPPPAGGNNPNFNGGLELGADVKPYPTSIPSSLTNAASAGGMVFQGNTTVTLVSNGTMRVTNANAGIGNQTMSLPGNGVLYVNGGNLTISGTLSGQMTAAASGDVRLPGGLTYADDPRTNPNSQDLLGIVAGGNVMVSNAAPQNMQIDATVMALGTSFTVQNWDTIAPKGTLTVYGGIIQKNRGPVGTFSSRTGMKVSGYTKDYHYDTRLQNRVPPFFPLTGDYSVLSWEEPGA